MASIFTPTDFSVALGPYAIDINDCMGDSVGIMNANTNYLAAGIRAVSATPISIVSTNTNLTNNQTVGVNTSSAAVTVTLPASPSIGNRVQIFDSHRTWDTNNCTVGRNSSLIEGTSTDLVCDVEGVMITLIYVSASRGWCVYSG